MTTNLRNIAIIAHIDHGKTTLVDKLIQQSDNFNSYAQITERLMDSNILEKERGITILAKNTSIQWENYHINIIDTPGHADFSGEVERIMSMVDAVVLVVDATEGPMPQTQFVTQKAFSYMLKPIVVINKIDRPNARPHWVLNKIFDLFINLNATDEQLNFPIVYTSALHGIAGFSYDKIEDDITPLYKTIIKHVPAPNANINWPLQMQIFQLEYDQYLGLICVARIKSGIVKSKQDVAIINKEGKVRYGKISKVLRHFALERIQIDQAQAGDIISITGLNDINISDTICDINNLQALPALHIAEPTVTMLFNVNTSPFAGKEGTYITSRQIWNRLFKESRYNVTFRIEKTQHTDIFRVFGRGELHLSILIENMRREGYELAVSRPKVILRNFKDRQQEPFEHLNIYIKKKYQGHVMKEISSRQGSLEYIDSDNQEDIQLKYIIPSRGLIGFRGEFLNLTSGTGIIYSTFSHYGDVCVGRIKHRENGVLIANSTGKALAFSLFNLQQHGKLFINHGTYVYEGQIIGVHNRSNDLTVNCLTGKKLTNMRASGTDEAINLVSPINLTLEQAIEFINDDELVEVTPKSIRIRKYHLKSKDRKRISD